jgi:hypothetical protein
MRQHMSAYISICSAHISGICSFISSLSYLSAYVSIRQLMPLIYLFSYLHLQFRPLECGSGAIQLVAHSACHTPAYVSIRQHTSACVSIRQHTFFFFTEHRDGLDCLQSRFTQPASPVLVHLYIRQHTSACGFTSPRTPVHTSAYVSMRLRQSSYTCTYVSIRQHTSAYVSASPLTPVYIYIYIYIYMPLVRY